MLKGIRLIYVLKLATVTYHFVDCILVGNCIGITWEGGGKGWSNAPSHYFFYLRMFEGQIKVWVRVGERHIYIYI